MVKRAETNGKIAKSRGGLTSKIHAVTDGNGKPMRFIITAGNVNDSTQAIALMHKIIRAGVRVLADRPAKKCQGVERKKIKKKC
jgi:predicted peroxiredoxin